MRFNVLSRFTLVAALSLGTATGQAQLAIPMPSASTSSTDQGRTGPSLEETTKWITDKLASTPPFKFDDGGPMKVSTVFNGCEMLLTRENLHEGNARRFFMRLQDLDPVRVKASTSRDNVDSAGVDLHVRDDKRLVMFEVTSTGRRSVYEVPSDYTPPSESSREGMERLKAGRKAAGGWRGVETYGGPDSSSSARFWLRFSDFAVAQALEGAFRTAIELCIAKSKREGMEPK